MKIVPKGFYFAVYVVRLCGGRMTSAEVLLEGILASAIL